MIYSLFPFLNAYVYYLLVFTDGELKKNEQNNNKLMALFGLWRIWLWRLMVPLTQPALMDLFLMKITVKNQWNYHMPVIFLFI